MLDATIKEYGLVQTPFTKRTANEVFEYATKYLSPFTPEGHGEGFQDMVILLSVLDHFSSTPDRRAVLISSDSDFKDINATNFLPGFDSNRFQIWNSLKAAVESLWEPYFDETAIKPYQQEFENAQSAAKDMIPEIAEFIKARLTEDMLKPGVFDTILKILSVEHVKVYYVETPFPEPEQINRTVEIVIKVSGESRVLVKRDLSYVNVFLKLEEHVFHAPLQELEEKVYWFFDIQATASFENTQVKIIEFTGLVPQKT